MVAILVDDGLATGATMAAACEWARAGGATRVVVAVPVAAADSLSALGESADAVVCPHPIVDFHAVSLWYGDFSPVPMSEVIRLVRGAREGDAAERRGA
jgi:putative phosphoribosyl transferase